MSIIPLSPFTDEMVFFLAQSAAVPWYLNPAFLPAATGLLGVVLGGLITGGSAYLVDQRREIREREREERERTEELRKAARLMRLDLWTGRHSVETAAKEGRFFRFSNDPLAELCWPHVKTIFAVSLSTEQWNIISLAVHMLALFKGLRDSALSQGKPQLTPDGQKTCENILNDIEKAQAILKPFV